MVEDIIITSKKLLSGARIVLKYDTIPTNPRDPEINKIHSVLAWHRRHHLGGDYSITPDAFLMDIHKKHNPQLFHDLDADDIDTIDDVPESMLERFSTSNIPGIFHNVYIYEHGNIALSTAPYSCSFDSGQLGFIYLPPDEIKNHGWTDEQAERVVQNELQQYKNYINGEVFLMILYDGEEIREALGDIYSASGDICLSNEELDQIAMNSMDLTDSERESVLNNPWV